MFPAPQDNPELHEALFRAAEIQAFRKHSSQAVPVIALAANDGLDEQRLLQTACRELERRAVRRRYLPDALFGDVGWWILLDLFVSDYEICRIKLIEAPSRWNLSHATAARQIAALIEASLIMRVFSDGGTDAVTLRLTDLGKIDLRRVLALCE